MYERIVVPTDGSSTAETAGESALRLAQRLGAAVTVVHVREEGRFPEDPDSETIDSLHQLGEELVERIAQRATEYGVQVTTDILVPSDTVHGTIVNYAERNDFDLIVMGTKGRTGMDRYLLGSVTERTLRTSSIPVLTVQESHTLDPDFDSVLLPTDGSGGALAATDHAISLAEDQNLSLHVVHVVDISRPWVEVDNARMLEALEESGKKAVDSVLTSAKAEGVDSIQANVLRGRPGRAIVDYTAEHDIDVIVMGTHGRTGLRRYLLGSVTESVVRVANTPVLAVSQRLNS